MQESVSKPSTGRVESAKPLGSLNGHNRIE